MRRKAVTALLIIICFILQCTVCQSLALAGISPNLLLIVTTSLSGEKKQVWQQAFSADFCRIYFLAASLASTLFCTPFWGTEAACFI